MSIHWPTTCVKCEEPYWRRHCINLDCPEGQANAAFAQELQKQMAIRAEEKRIAAQNKSTKDG